MVILRDIQQLTYEEIAGITNTEMGTVKSRINRGRAQLQQLLKSLYEEVFGTSRPTELSDDN
jgi:RNA polymerase sigma-70 factor (ECF subfamily)